MSSPPTDGPHRSRSSAQDYAQAIRADYIAGETPWDTGVPNPELIRMVEKGGFPGSGILELGCGTGTNAVELARRGYRVTAVDLADVAIFKARERATTAGVNVDFRVGDLTQMDLGGPYDGLLDLGVYHGIRNRDLDGFLRAVVRLSRPGTRWLCIAGSANSPRRDGPPVVREEEFRAELGSAFKILDAHEFTYLELAPDFRPPFWSILMERR